MQIECSPSGVTPSSEHHTAPYNRKISSNPQNPQYEEMYQNSENTTFYNGFPLFPHGEENEESEEMLQQRNTVPGTV